MAFFCRVVFLIAACVCFFAGSGRAAGDCENPVGTMVSVDGEAYVLHHGQTSWESIQLDNRLCAGDMPEQHSHLSRA